MDDPYRLQRFVDAQQGVYAKVLDELRAGRKRRHWIWFVFPPLKGLGRSATAQHFGLAGADEALAYWRHPVLGARLQECTTLTLQVPHRTALQLFGTPDDLKFRSCMTLFREVAPEASCFALALQRYWGGEPDVQTLSLLQSAQD